MAGIEIISKHPLITALILVGGFTLWKFVIQPIMNEGKPLDPDENQVDGNLGLDLENLEI